MTAAHVQVVERDGAVWVTLNAPERRNALDEAAIECLREAAGHTQEIGAAALVITGSGCAFTAGGDVRWFAEVAASGDVAPLQGVFRRAAEMLWALADLPVPVVSGVNGVCAAGGLEIVCFSDLVIASSAAMFLDGHGNLGLLPVAGTVTRLVSRVGLAQANRLLLLGEVLTAAEALEIGLVGEVVSPEALDGRLSEVCRRLGGRPAGVLGAMKRLAADVNPPGARERELEAALANAAAPHVRAGIARFVGSRKAGIEWEGEGR